MRNLKNDRYVEASDAFRTDSTELGLAMDNGVTALIPRSSMKYYDKTKENTKANNGVHVDKTKENTKANNGVHGDGATGEDGPEL